jgi:RNA polymerase sigma-70 factor (ECF subfamily)
MSLQDKDYVEGARAGETQLFEQLVRRYNRMGGAIAYGVLGDFQRAEDVVQEAFLKAFRALDTLREPSRFKQWFAEIVRCKALDAARVRREQTVADVEAGVGRESPYRSVAGGVEEEHVRRETQQRLLAAIRSLPAPDRTVITLKHMDGLSYKEIAEVTETTVSAVESRLFRARKMLKERLSSWHSGDSSQSKGPSPSREN